MELKLEYINYQDLKPRQQENYNFQKISALLADYGLMTIRLSDDWAGADFIAQHISGIVLKVQLKGRLTIMKKYLLKDLWVCFPNNGTWYLYPHDVVVNQLLEKTAIGETKSWVEEGGYSFPVLSKRISSILEPYKLKAIGTPKTDKRR